ncbi:MAG: hypothetical protein A2W31_02885 [Planctomycetes bacterium RBG_16_64_10]|nr:MAG: hypothetical protein A2W31_02885 [Planctomycetes bacterium RBG_16_64_10]
MAGAAFRSDMQDWGAEGRGKPLALQTLMRHASIGTTLAYYVDQAADDIAAELWEGNNPGNKRQQAGAAEVSARWG